MYFISGDLVSQAPTTKTPPPTFSRKQSGKSKKSESNQNRSGNGNRVVPDFDTVYSRGGITIRTQRLVADGSAISTGQLISECPFDVLNLNFPKNQSNIFDKFLPKNLKSGQIIR